MQFHIITIFPKIFDSYFNHSILARAQKQGLVKINIYDLRQWADDPHRQVDDRPYGGGPGMVLMPGPIIKAIQDIKKKTSVQTQTILFSARGQAWTQAKARNLARKQDDIIMICGRYEGVDERVRYFVDKTISIGKYVLTGGELPAMVVVDSITRLLPGVLGNKQSAKDESFSQANVLEYPQYTRPEVLEINGQKFQVPDVLLSGNHAAIKKWREKQKKLRHFSKNKIY